MADGWVCEACEADACDHCTDTECTHDCEAGAGPTPRTAVDVLREHQVHGIGPGCTCGWRVTVGSCSLYQHQANMLAAAGMLATAEHDREVAAQERQNIVVRLAEMAANYEHDDLPDEHPTACIYEVLTDAADRIAAGEKP